jgi:hypothetical protein
MNTFWVIVLIACAFSPWMVFIWLNRKRRKNIGWVSTYTYRIWNNHPLKILPVDIDPPKEYASKAADDYIKKNPSVRVLGKKLHD